MQVRLKLRGGKSINGIRPIIEYQCLVRLVMKLTDKWWNSSTVTWVRPVSLNLQEIFGKLSTASKRKIPIRGWIGLFWGLTISLHLRMGELTVTGDEPRYIFGGLQPWLGGGQRTVPNLNAWVSKQGIASLLIEPERGPHSLLHVWLISPILKLGGLGAARWTVLLCALLALTYFAVRFESKTTWQRLFMTSLFTWSMPIFPYLRLLYSEIWGGLIVAILLVLVSKQVFNKNYWFFAFVLTILLPFLHIRFTPTATIFGLIFLRRWWKLPRNRVKRKVLIQSSIGLALFIIFKMYQNALSGGRTSSIPALAPNFGDLIERSAIHLLGYRHGILIFNPLVLLGLAGFVLGIRNRERMTMISTVLFFGTFFGFIWGSGMESYPGRFWVVAMPPLIVGATYWFTQASRYWRWLASFPLLFIALLNTFIMINRPTDHLSNRFGLLSYESIVHRMGDRIFPDLITLKDPFDMGIIKPIYNNHSIVAMMLISVLSLALASIAINMKSLRTSGLLIGVMTSLSIVNLILVQPVPQDKYKLDTGIDAENRSYISVTFFEPISVSSFKFGDFNDWPLWGIDARAPKEFLIDGVKSGGGRIDTQVLAGFQFGEIATDERLKTLRLTSMNSETDLNWTSLRLRLFR